MRNSEKLKARSRSVYKANPSKKKAAAAALYKLQPDKKMESSKAYYCCHKAQKKACYIAHKVERNAADRVAYRANAEKEKLQQRLITLQTLSLNVLPLELFIDPSLK